MLKYAALLNICKVKYHSKIQLRNDRVIISREKAAAKLKLDFQLEEFRKLKLKFEIKEEKFERILREASLCDFTFQFNLSAKNRLTDRFLYSWKSVQPVTKNSLTDRFIS